MSMPRHTEFTRRRARWSPKTRGCGRLHSGPRRHRAFEKKLEAVWWPQLRDSYSDPPRRRPIPGAPTSACTILFITPRGRRGASRSPIQSHLHIDLLPRLQGRGLGRRLAMRGWREWRDMGSTGTHSASDGQRARVRFYAPMVLRNRTLRPPFNVIYFGMKLQ